MASESEVPSQSGGWLTVYYVYTLLIATACLMEAIGLRSSDVFTVYLLKFGVYAFAAISLKQIGASWVAKFHIGLNAVVVIAGVLAMFAYGIPYAFVALIPWPMLTYFDHPWTYPLLPLAWTIYWVVSKRVKAAYPATGASGIGAPENWTKEQTTALNLWSTRAWVIAMIIAAMSLLMSSFVSWFLSSGRVPIMSLANEQGDRWRLIYLAYPPVLLAVWVFAYRQITLKKLRRAKIIAVIPFALYILSGTADLSDKAVGMQFQRASAIKYVYMDRMTALERSARNPEGPFTKFHDNGQVRQEGRYDDNGQLNGLVTRWYRSGQKESEFIYKESEVFLGGEPTDGVLWYENGQKQEERREDMQLGWTEDGQLITEITLGDDGQPHSGFSSYTYPDGERIDERYLDGSKIGFTAWYENGQMKHEESGRRITQFDLASEKRWYENGQKQFEICRESPGINKYQQRWDESGTLTSRPYDGDLECP
jgi:antitoxin component YwqK of YwqJK toxin-antitoxin module